MERVTIRNLEINEYRHQVHDWVKNKPTLSHSHTPEALMFLIYGELEELKAAKQQDEIIMELGDVFFSIMALDDRDTSDPIQVDDKTNVNDIEKTVGQIGKNIRHFKKDKPPGKNLPRSTYKKIDKAYAQIENVCLDNNISLDRLFSLTYRKNRINYPDPFFDSRTPFPDPQDAINCVRLFRKIHKGQNKLNDFWLKLDTYIESEMAFYDIWYVTQKFREFLKNELKSLAKNPDQTINSRAKNLLEKGYWEISPLTLDGKIIYRK